jgi:hypothetical protein
MQEHFAARKADSPVFHADYLVDDSFILLERELFFLAPSSLSLTAKFTREITPVGYREMYISRKRIQHSVKKSQAQESST